MQIKVLSIAAALALAFAGSAYAQSTPSSNMGKPSVDRKAKKAEEEKIEADAKAAKAKCDPMKGNEKDVCQAEAKAHEKVAKAELDAKYSNTPRNQRKVEETKAEGEYEVAKEKCESMKDGAHACKKEAKAKYDRAKADIKAKHARADKNRAAATGSSTERTK
jgi:hypothetical protein